MLGLDAPDGAVNALAQAIADTPPEVTRHRIRLVAAVDMKGAFQALTLPTLSLRARGDRLVPEAAQRAMANLRRSLEAITIDGPHLLLQRNPEGTARAIGAFLQRTVSGT
jgi:pimeloyl-ACP methyl ester carboxylesterase